MSLQTSRPPTPFLKNMFNLIFFSFSVLCEKEFQPPFPRASVLAFIIAFEFELGRGLEPATLQFEANALPTPPSISAENTYFFRSLLLNTGWYYRRMNKR